MALAPNPALLILDEPTTGLDATVEAEVLDLVAGLRTEFESSVLFISHNLAVIAKMCDTVGVLYAGKLVEEGPARQVFDDPRHPYTVGLLRCIPKGGQRKDKHRLDTIPGFLPELGADLPGCVFADRCALAEDRCRTEPPPLYDVGPGRGSRCHFHERAQTLPREEAHEMPMPAGARGGRAAAPRRRAGQDVPPVGPRRARAGRRVCGDLAGRDAGPGRRVGQRQDDARPGAARHHAAGRGRRARARRGARCRRPPASGRRSRCARSRSCSRTRTRRSTAGTPCG